MIDCHIKVDVKKALRPKRWKTTEGEALINASTIGLENPFGLMVGASAINKLTLSFNSG
jgi:hypothetical protein